MKDGENSELTPAEIAQRRAARTRHGLYDAFAHGEAGEEVLTLEQRSRLAELRELVSTPEGLEQIVQEQTARAVLIVERADADIETEIQDGTPILSLPAVRKVYFTAKSELRRWLDFSWRITSRGDGGPSAGDVLDALREKREQSQ